MGMFDYVRIKTSKLPISDEEKALLGENPGWQTKDLECLLSTAEITDEGRLMFEMFSYGFDPDATNGFGIKGCLTHENVRLIDLNMHGLINFYTHDKNGDWWEFNAKFTDGNLVSIERVRRH